MKLEIAFLFFFIFSGTFCLAQSSVSKGGNAVASSQIRVSIPSFAIINLAKNNSKSVAYNSSSDLKEVVELNNNNTKVVANDKWSVNVVREMNNTYTSVNKETILNKPVSPTYTVIYVTTPI